VIKAQVLLDRARFSPGEIDGKQGDNFKKAIRAFAVDQGLPSTDVLTEEVWQKLNSTSADPVVTEYTINHDDVRGPFAKSIPTKMEEMKDVSQHEAVIEKDLWETVPVPRPIGIGRARFDLCCTISTTVMASRYSRAAASAIRFPADVLS
jgi:peptidoglycan hydrolase-like protein with peptidoglycan-binding domain